MPHGTSSTKPQEWYLQFSAYWLGSRFTSLLSSSSSSCGGGGVGVVVCSDVRVGGRELEQEGLTVEEQCCAAE